MELGGDACLDARDVAKEPEEKINSVDALIHEGAAAVKGESAAPSGVGVILRRAIPLDAGVHKQDFAEEALVEPGFELAEVGLETILKKHAESYVGLIGSGDKGVGAGRGDVQGLFDENVQAMPGGGDAVLGVKAGGAADDDEVHRPMLEEAVEVVIESSGEFAGEESDLFRVGAVDRGNCDAGNGACGASVSLGDVAATD